MKTPLYFYFSTRCLVTPATIFWIFAYPKPPLSFSISMTISTLTVHTPFFLRRHFSSAPFLTLAKFPSSSITLSHRFLFRTITIERLSIKTPIHAAVSASSNSLQPIEELPPKLQEIVKLFQGVQEPKAKYEQLLFYGKNLKPLDSKYKTSENKVQGCVSQVWVRAYLDGDRIVVFEADSDSVLTKGLAALLVQGLSGHRVEEIDRVSPDFAVLLGLQQSLTPSRNNGFLNMLKLMQRKAKKLIDGTGKDGDLSSSESSFESPDENSMGELNEHGGNGIVEETPKIEVSSKESGNGSVLGSRGRRIKEKLEKVLRPLELEIEDISYQHAGHAGVRGSDGETHFNVKVVSEEFNGKSLVKRHRLVYNSLQDELEGGLHALSIEAKTPSEVGSS